MNELPIKILNSSGSLWGPEGPMKRQIEQCQCAVGKAMLESLTCRTVDGFQWHSINIIIR